MNGKYIIRSVNKLIQRAGTNDPIIICKRIGISLSYHNLPPSLKGYYIRHHRIPNIVLNQNLSTYYIPLVAGHELGHHCIHNEDGMFQEYNFSNRDPLETEANCFDAELLLNNDEKVIEVLREDRNLYQAASCLGVPDWLLECKLKLLNEKGYNFNDLNLISAKNMKDNRGAFEINNFQ